MKYDVPNDRPELIDVYTRISTRPLRTCRLPASVNERQPTSRLEKR